MLDFKLPWKAILRLYYMKLEIKNFYLEGLQTCQLFERQMHGTLVPDWHSFYFAETKQLYSLEEKLTL